MRTRNDVIQTQFVSRLATSTILTLVIIPSEQILAVESNRLHRHLVEPRQTNDPWYLQLKANCLDVFLTRLLVDRCQLAQFTPAFKVVAQILVVLVVNHFGALTIQQRERSANVDHTNRHVEAIQNQNIRIEHTLRHGCYDPSDLLKRGDLNEKEHENEIDEYDR